ncbi:MAG: hypothetical protein ACO1O1_07775 [Adhaeribacter sp.]
MPEEMENMLAKLEEERKIMAAYTDTAKTYTQLSLGGLVLSITFMEKVLGQSGPVTLHYLLILAWIFWLSAALAGAFYQYLAVKFLENLGLHYGILKRSGHPQAFADLSRHPYKVYGFFLVCFYAGTVCFALFGILKIL